MQVSTVKIEFEFERNTPKINLTLYVPIMILLVLFLGSILIPSKPYILLLLSLYIKPTLFFQLHPEKNLDFKSLYSYHLIFISMYFKIYYHRSKIPAIHQLHLFSSLSWSWFSFLRLQETIGKCIQYHCNNTQKCLQTPNMFVNIFNRCKWVSGNSD